MVISIKSIFITVTILCSMFTSTTSQMQTVISITGTVTNFVTKKPTSVLISLYDNHNKKIGSSVSNSKTGYYFITGLRSKKHYIIRIKSIDYITEEYDMIKPIVDEYMTVTKDFEVMPKSR